MVYLSQLIKFRFIWQRIFGKFILFEISEFSELPDFSPLPNFRLIQSEALIRVWDEILLQSHVILTLIHKAWSNTGN